ncbi:MAG: hypothetical protein SGI74_11265 [Oligoflexia bacterium]|nr:hypothetical protein [Oligoflexia bacterium]
MRRFQYRYAVFLASFGAALAIIIGGLTLYLLNHNYDLFMKAELLTAPQLVDNLGRELKLANEILVTALIGFILVMGGIGVRFSHRIVVPIYLIQEKMREICRGNFFSAKVSIRKNDEFQEFAETYNYLVESMRTQLKSDLLRLEKLKPDEHNRDAVHTWECLVREKEAQLNGQDSAAPDPTASSRHAS